ncbi:MAG: sigma-70 family RNA polymerase sigma factor [Phycisphaerales bacterium]|nr:sigma-70 family RNA polymerase sigma factor [Phycisphaerales bacterium]
MPIATPTDRANDSPDARAAAWCRGIRAGDPAALTDFYQHWFDRSVAIVRARTGRDDSFALDVVQDAMIRVARSTPKLDSDADLSRWMIRVLTTCSLDRLKQESREAARRRVARNTASDTSVGCEMQGNDCSRPNIHESMEGLRRHLGELRPEQRAALSLRFWFRRSLAAIGRALSISDDAAHGKLRASLRSLQRASQGDNEP